MADETTQAVDALTADEFEKVQAALGGRGYTMVAFEVDGFFARFDVVQPHERRREASDARHH